MSTSTTIAVYFPLAIISDDYFLAGRTIAVCLVHGGPAPERLSRSLFQALVEGPERIRVPFTEMPQSSLKETLEQVCAV